MVTNSHKGTEKTKHGLVTGRTKLCCQKSRTPCKGAEGSKSRKGDRTQIVEGPAVRLSLDSNPILPDDPQAPTFSCWINYTTYLRYPKLPHFQFKESVLLASAYTHPLLSVTCIPEIVSCLQSYHRNGPFSTRSSE